MVKLIQDMLISSLNYLNYLPIFKRYLVFKMYNKLLPQVILFSSITMAEVLYVPAEFLTIQDAIEASESGDSVLVSPGLYQENINFEGKPITVSSMYLIGGDSLLIGTTIIDGQQNGKCCYICKW